MRFLKFGLLAWGGPVAQIAMLKRELVEEEQWLSTSRFNRMLAVFQILPGPEAHEMCVHLGMMKRGRLGGLLAGLGFMLPGVVLMIMLAWAYSQLDINEPPLQPIFLGVQVAVLALVARAVHRIAEHTIDLGPLGATALVAGALSLSGVTFWIVLPAAGLIYMLLRSRKWFAAALVLLVTILAAGLFQTFGIAEPATVTKATVLGEPTTLDFFWTGLKGGLLTFGGAYTAIPFVRHDSVGRGWVTDGQFLDAIALVGIIPAPLVVFATFVGFQAGGLPGALAITAGMFLPAFSFSLLFFDRLEQVVEDNRLHGFLEGVAAAVVGFIAVTLLDLGHSVAQVVPSIPAAAMIFAAALAALYLWKSRFSVLAVLPLAGLAGLLTFG